MVPSGIEPLIPALLARCLNQLGQGTSRRSSIEYNHVEYNVIQIDYTNQLLHN